jgi:hypothetical protein
MLAAARGETGTLKAPPAEGVAAWWNRLPEPATEAGRQRRSGWLVRRTR